MYSRLGVVRRTDDETGRSWVAVHEIYCNQKDEIVGIAEYPIDVVAMDGDGLEDIVGEIQDLLEEGEELDYDAHPKLDSETAGCEEVFRASEVLPTPTHDPDYSVS